MGNYPRTGLRLRSEAGVHPVVRSVSIKFCKWLRTQMEFPVRGVIYLKKDFQIKNRTTKQMVTATFLAPYEKDVEPYIRIATGDYDELIKDRGKSDALYTMLDTSVFTFGALSTRLPVNVCCIIFANREIITIKLNKDRAEANNLTLAPDNLTAYASVSIEWIININRDIRINFFVKNSKTNYLL